MMTNFYSSFGDDANKDKEVPKEIIEELNKDIPHNLEYIQYNEGDLIIVPRKDHISEGIRLSTQIDLETEKDEELKKRLQQLPREKWSEYLYRIQKSIAVKDIKIGDDEQLIPIEQTTSNPLSDETALLSECRMIPEKFKEPFAMTYESADNKKIELLIRQQVYDSFTELKFSNINYPAIKYDLYVYAPISEENEKNARTNKNKQVCSQYSVSPTKACTVSEAVDALKIFKGICLGNIKINGKIDVSPLAENDYDSEKIENALEFWSTAMSLEKILGVKFDPGADFPMEDARFFSQLNFCLIENKAVVWKQPFSHFRVNNFSFEDSKLDEKDLIGTKPYSFEFIEGPIPVTLLGAEFELYSLTKLCDFSIENIEWDDDTKKSGEFYIKDAPGKTWTVSRLFMTKKRAESIKQGKLVG